MPYDPRMLQLARMGIGMMGPQQGSPFANASQQPPQRQEQPPPAPGQGGNSIGDYPGQSANAPKQPPSMYEMMLNLGRMTPAQYNKAMQQSGPPQQQQGLAQASPWAWLGSMGGGPSR